MSEEQKQEALMAWQAAWLAGTEEHEQEGDEGDGEEYHYMA